MTPFRNDDGNPFNRQSVWPKMPQAPIRLGPLPKAARPSEPPPAIEEPKAFAEPIAPIAPAPDVPIGGEGFAAPVAPEPLREPPPGARPIAAPIGLRRAPPPRREVRLTPLIAAAAVGAGATAALFLMVGVGESAKPAAAPTLPRSAIAVGDMVGKSAPTPVPPTTAAPPAPARAAPRPAAKLAAAQAVRHPAAAAPISVPAAADEPVAAPLQLPPPAPLASLAGPQAAPAAPYVPPPRPDREAPIATHRPDGS